MSSQEPPRQELASTYVVQDRSNLTEMERLFFQDEMLTTAMGGVLAEQENPQALRRVLDVGCGTGGWLIETAKAYPQIELLIGVDISATMLDFARAKAQEAGVADRVEFQVGDALRMLEFPDSFFDLVNQRAGMSYLRTWDWPNILREYQRVTAPTGIIRITEFSSAGPTTSPAFTRFSDLLTQVFYQAGYFFELDAESVINHLESLLHQHGLRNVQTLARITEYRVGTRLGDLALEDGKRLLRTMEPFLRRWIRLPDDYDAICQQALEEIERPDSVAHGKMLTAWGLPRYKKDVPVYGSSGY